MNAVGIDVSKGKSMVAIMRPFGEIVSAPFEINPFLAAVTACRTVKVSIHTRIGLVKDADKIA